MKTYKFAALAAVALTLAGAVTAAANQIAGVLLTGTLTAPPSTDYIKVDGHNYHIRTGSTAATDVHTVTQGQRVDVRLSGPANTSSSEVISISAHQEK